MKQERASLAWVAIIFAMFLGMVAIQENPDGKFCTGAPGFATCGIVWSELIMMMLTAFSISFVGMVMVQKILFWLKSDVDDKKDTDKK